MKNALLLLTAIALFGSCKDKDLVEPVACNDPSQTRMSLFEDLETRVERVELMQENNIKEKVYVIADPQYKDKVYPWIACNLPDEFKKDGLRVRISGYYLYVPGSENASRLSRPVELTQICRR